MYNKKVDIKEFTLTTIKIVQIENIINEIKKRREIKDLKIQEPIKFENILTFASYNLLE